MPSVGTKRLKWSADCRIFVGHTTMDDITFLWDGRVVAVNVDYCENFKSGRGMAVLLERKHISIVR